MECELLCNVFFFFLYIDFLDEFLAKDKFLTIGLIRLVFSFCFFQMIMEGVKNDALPCVVSVVGTLGLEVKKKTL